MSEQQRSSKTVLGADCRITGELALESDALILGEFKGTLRVSGVLEIADSAHVVGTIVAGALRVAGRIEADVVAEHGVELLAGAQLSGHLYATTLSVVEGAVLQSEVCVGPKAIQAAGAILRQVEEAISEQNASNGAAGRSEAQEEAVGSHADWQAGSEQADESVEMSDEQVDEEPEPIVAPVRTIPSTLNSMLSRRRAKVLTGSSMKPMDSDSHSLKPGPTARAS
ncbi:MAG: polymer-forming cytoskeletal protein [Planctomycetota bacterium]|nr:polymer-forming cytoskeletal protein [Planctomycetota bacterium]